VIYHDGEGAGMALQARAALRSQVAALASVKLPAGGALRWLIAVAIVVASYYGAAKLGLSLAFATEQVTAVWPPTGVALAAFVLLGPRVWPGVYLGALLANAGAHEPISAAAGIAIGNTAMVLVGWVILRRVVRFDPALQRTRDVFGLTLAAAVAAVVSASNGVANLALRGLVPWSDYASVWRVWWFGDAMGILLVAPALLLWLGWRPPRWSGWARFVETAGIFLALAVVSTFVFLASFVPPDAAALIKFMVFPFIMWVGLRLGPRGSASAALIVATVAIWGAIQERGPFSSMSSPDARLAVLQLFIAAVAVTALTVGAVVAEREQAQGDLQRALERRRAEERFRRLLESAPDAMVIFDEAGAIALVNARAEALFGYRRQELLGRSVEMLLPENFRGRHEAQRAAAFTGITQPRPTGAGRELNGLRKTGEEFPVEISLSPLETADGVLVSAAIRDITERKLSEKKLAQLHEQQRHVALTLQRSLMGLPPDVPGMPAASRYLPAGQGAGVGGDWFDVIPLGAGRVAMLIGDVMGRGLEAAALMGQLRSAAHALAKTGMPPRQLMQALDSVVTDLADPLVTCCCLVAEPDVGQVVICSAGHVPALLVGPDTSVRPIPVPVSVPLGVGGVPHQQVSVPVLPDSHVLLYTDGLVESRHADIGTNLRTLEVELEAAFADALGLEDTADRVLSALLPEVDGYEDDVTLLLARLPAPPLDSACTEFAAEPAAVAAGRRFLAGTVQAWGCAELSETASLLTSELVTNAICHGRGPLRLQVQRTLRELTVEVTDHSPRPLVPRLAGCADEAGRGLMLVDALSDSWGWRSVDDGKTAWFTLQLERTPPLPQGAGVPRLARR
jgi:PAS domain S-box-containing protein